MERKGPSVLPCNSQAKCNMSAFLSHDKIPEKLNLKGSITKERCIGKVHAYLMEDIKKEGIIQSFLESTPFNLFLLLIAYQIMRPSINPCIDKKGQNPHV